MHDIWQADLHIMKLEALPGFVLRLTYGDGEVYEVSLADWVGTGGQSDALVDQAYFAQARIGEDGDWIEWQNGLDIGADTLRWDGELARRDLTRADVPPGA